MKTQFLTKKMNYRNLVLTGFAAIALFLVSCEKTEDAYIAEDIKAAQEAGALKGAPDDRGKANPAPAPGDLSIYDLAVEEGLTGLAFLIGFVDAEPLNAGLQDLFQNGTDQYTVFAPSNQAVNELVAFLVDNDIEITQDLVYTVLRYHVTEGRRAANSVVPKNKDRKIMTLLGESFNVTSGGEIKAIGNTANIAAPNFSASNGIVHVIDAVILPVEVEDLLP